MLGHVVAHTHPEGVGFRSLCVNTNDYSFTIELDTGYAIETGDVIVVTYPAVDNPAEAGEYAVEVTLNDAQNATGTLAIEAEETT